MGSKQNLEGITLILPTQFQITDINNENFLKGQ
jgi:hypothetical protein